MQLVLLKRRLALARRGHKLLKDRPDGLVVEFLSTKKEFTRFHDKIETPLRQVFARSAAASALSAQNHLRALAGETSELEAKVTYKNIMGISIPRYELSFYDKDPDRLAGRSIEFFEAARDFKRVFPELVEFSSLLETLKLLSRQIMETRRRVNALEHILIPELSKTAKSIKMKLEESERSSRTVLLKLSEQKNS